MPGFDATGPRGMGPRTGGGRGFCAPIGPGATPYSPCSAYRGWAQPPAPWGGYAPPYYQPYAGAGGWPYAPQMSREQEIDFLRNEADHIKAQLDAIEARIREMEQPQE